jgi:cell volume regulation protein A
VTDIRSFAVAVLFSGLAVLVAILANRVTARTRIPTPVLLLVAAAVAVKVIPDLHAPDEKTASRLVTVALLFILFDGGMQVGLSRFRTAAAPIASAGLLGTFLTAGAAAALAHYALDINWYAALLVGTAIAPTDPAVVFSVLGGYEVEGRAGTILEGESGANDPVGIALMTSLIAAGNVSAGSMGHVLGEFLLQMGVGAAIGAAGGVVLLYFMRRVRLPNAALYSLRALAGALVFYGLATIAHGSGFLAVFVAGMVIGDEAVPRKREIGEFAGALSSLGEIVAFLVLGLTVDLDVLARTDVWAPGLLIAAVVAFVIRPVLVGACLLPARLARNELAFVLFAGLKGAVPLLLGSFILASGAEQASRLYGVVVIVVIFSVAVQGTLVPATARLLRLPMRELGEDPGEQPA